METKAKNPTPELLRAAQYLRMSTEHQQYSLANQSAAIALYAAAHQILIVKSYVDPGKSGLTIRQRNALQELIQTVRSGTADFECILVYDISRWGRFQDIDEAAHYEYLCRAAGVSVRYCAEQFENDNSLISGLLKSMKRMMAAEYSRELSARITAAHHRLARMGYCQGGVAPYGLGRMLVDSDSRPKQFLAHGERKAIQTDRVIYVLGSPDEVASVQKIFDLCTRDGKTPGQIADELNEAGLQTRFGVNWTSCNIRYMIRNPKYMGTYVYFRNSKRLDGPLIKNEPGLWIVKKRAFPAIISPMQFQKAQIRLARLLRRYTDEQMLNKLQQLWKEKGNLTAKIVNESKGGPCLFTYQSRFGGANAAFALAGFTRPFDYSVVAELRRRLRKIERGLRSRLVDQMKARGVHVSEHPRSHFLTVNGELTIDLRVIHYRCGSPRWPRAGWHCEVRFREGVEILILACLDNANREIAAQYVFPKISQLQGLYCSSVGKERVYLEAFRSDTLEPLLDSVSRYPIQELATA